jgi:hypothetical protein
MCVAQDSRNCISAYSREMIYRFPQKYVFTWPPFEQFCRPVLTSILNSCEMRPMTSKLLQNDKVLVVYAPPCLRQPQHLYAYHKRLHTK